jgi:hypothetical protein
MNRKKRVTRKRVNDSVIDSVLNDVYDELDKLQASNEYNIASSNVDNQGEYTTYSAPGGANYFAINTENGWMVDVNSQFEPIAGSSFQPSVGVQGLTKLPTKHESLKYNEDLQILSHSPFKIKESSTAVTDTAAYGQIWVKTASPNQLWFTNDAGNDIQLTSGTGTTFLSNNTADTMTVSDFGASPALRINADQPATAAAEDSVGLHIDYDRIVAASGTENHNDTGLDIDINSATLGTGIVTGIDIDVVGATSGTHTAVGADINVSGADTNIGLIINSPSEHIRMQASADAANDYATISVANTGDMTIATTGDGTTDSALILDIDGSITLNADSGIVDIKNDASAVYRGDTSGPVPTHYFYNSANNADYLKFTVSANGLTTFSTVDNDGTRGNIVFTPNGKFVVNADMGGVYIDESAAAGDDIAGDGQLWVKDDAPNNLYFTDDAGNDIALTNNGKSRVWTSTAGGYKTNNNSATSYYFQYYPNYHIWGNADSSPTSISYTDAYSYQWCANAPGKLTNISVTCRASDTGTTDPLKFYVYKGQPGNNATSTSLTLIGTTGTITPVASRQMFLSTDITSSNDFDAGDKLWVMYKKDSTSGNQDLYFAVTISGEYT